MGSQPLGPKKFSRLSDRVMTTSWPRKHSPSRQVTSSVSDWMRTVFALETRMGFWGRVRYSPAESGANSRAKVALLTFLMRTVCTTPSSIRASGTGMEPPP